MRQALHAEWTKLRTVQGPAWLLLATIALIVGGGVAVVASYHWVPGRSDVDTTKLSLTGTWLGQALVAMLGVVVVTGEYSTGMIRATITALPRRPEVLAAKACVVGGLTFIAASIAVLGSLLAARLILPGNGFTQAHGYAAISLGTGSTLRAAIGSILYLVLVGLLGLGIAFVIRDTATATGVVLGVLYLFPILAGTVTDNTWHRHLEQIGPVTAGLAVQTTRDLASQPIGPWAGLGVVVAWAAAALLAGGLLLQLRDA